MESRRRVFTVWFALVAAGLVGLAAVICTQGIATRDTQRLAQRIQAAGSKQTLFREVLPEKNWDTVCYLDPYDRPSRRLPLHLGQRLAGFDYEPSDRPLAEEENGLAFIDRKAQVVYVVPLAMALRAGVPNGIYRITGSRCLERESAAFRLERVDARNGSYLRLVFEPAQSS